MRSSIQEYCKKINRGLTFTDILSLFVTLLVVVILVVVISMERDKNLKEVVYKESEVSVLSQENNDGKPFGSVSGKTYTFSWCQGSSRISLKNKIYFSSTGEAESSGRTLSKLCRK
jgi:hypothetical protein